MDQQQINQAIELQNHELHIEPINSDCKNCIRDGYCDDCPLVYPNKTEN